MIDWVTVERHRRALAKHEQTDERCPRCNGTLFAQQLPTMLKMRCVNGDYVHLLPRKDHGV